MSTLLYILAATSLISILALIGILTLSFKQKLLDKIIIILVALSAGALMGGAFLHLIPEAIEKFSLESTFLFVILGFILFFLIEKILHWRHCHEEHCQIHSFAYINLFGDSVHNFIDGLIIAASFVASIPLGITTTLAVALHELPQEIGDFGVLVYAGFKRSKALLMNFLTAITAVLGGLIGFYLSSYAESFMMFLLPFAAGGFLYISASDLVPELRKELNMKKFSLIFITFLVGIAIMYLV